MQTTALLGKAGGRQSKKRLQVGTEALSKGLTLVGGPDFTLKVTEGRAGFSQPSGEQALQSHCLRMVTPLLSSYVPPAVSVLLPRLSSGDCHSPSGSPGIKRTGKAVRNLPSTLQGPMTVCCQNQGQKRTIK